MPPSSGFSGIELRFLSILIFPCLSVFSVVKEFFSLLRVNSSDKPMNRFWQMLLGIEPSSSAVSGGDTRLEFASMPKGPGARADRRRDRPAGLLWRLYRWERRDLTRTKRISLVALRGLTLLAVSIMLLEPVLVSSQRETIPSHLVMVLDDSESMKFSDPYTDESRAVASRRS